MFICTRSSEHSSTKPSRQCTLRSTLLEYPSLPIAAGRNRWGSPRFFRFVWELGAVFTRPHHQTPAEVLAFPSSPSSSLASTSPTSSQTCPRSSRTLSSRQTAPSKISGSPSTARVRKRVRSCRSKFDTLIKHSVQCYQVHRRGIPLA